jgi:hypothetical protein
METMGLIGIPKSNSTQKDNNDGEGHLEKAKEDISNPE